MESESKSHFDHLKLDEIIHSRIRLAIMSVLAANASIEFKSLRELVNATDGNLGSHLKKLEEAGYIAVTKEFVDRKPQTVYALSDEGRAAFREYLERLEGMLKR